MVKRATLEQEFARLKLEMDAIVASKEHYFRGLMEERERQIERRLLGRERELAEKERLLEARWADFERDLGRLAGQVTLGIEKVLTVLEGIERGQTGMWHGQYIGREDSRVDDVQHGA